MNARIGANYSDEYYTEIGCIDRLKQDSYATFPSRSIFRPCSMFRKALELIF